MGRFLAVCIGGCLVAVAVATAAASNIGAAPRKLLVVDRPASRGSKTIFVARDPAVVNGPATNVDQVCARMHVQYEGGPAAGTFVIPPGRTSGWVVHDSTSTKYRNRDAPGGPTQVKTMVLRRGSLVKVRAAGLGDVPLGLAAAGPPEGSVYVTVEVVDAGVTTRLCSELRDCRYGSIDGGTGAKLRCRHGVADPVCHGAPPVYTCGQDISYGGPGTVALIGDSITVQAAAAHEAALGAHWFVAVQAKRGAMFRELQDAARAIGRSKPQAVVIHLGTNDAACLVLNAFADGACRYPEFTHDDLLADARAMVASLGDACVVGTSPWIALSVGDLWRQMVTAGELAGVVPWAEYLESLPDDERDLLLLDDLGHLTAAGRVALAELTAQVVDQTCGGPP